jgi:hypothetical protein
MQALLVQADYEDALDSFGNKYIAEWTVEEKRKDCKAMSQIQLHLYNNILQEVLTEKTAAGLWSKLEGICMTRSHQHDASQAKIIYSQLQREVMF